MKKHKFTKEQLEWLAALESGQYEKGVGTLHRNSLEENYFCCLGVACKMYSSTLGIDVASGAGLHGDRTRYGRETSYAPEKVVEHLRLWDKRGSFKGPGFLVPLKKINKERILWDVKEPKLVDNLADLNDETFYTFAEIASIIRKHASQIFRPEV